FPLVISYWVTGGFFGFATGAPLLLFALAQAIRWFEAPSLARATSFALVACALHLWHGYLVAQLFLNVGALWLLFRFADGRARWRALVPLLPTVLLFALWMRAVAGRPHAAIPFHRLSFADNGAQFFGLIGPILPGATVAACLFVLFVVGSTFAA